MTNVLILHGTGSSPNEYWHPYLKNELTKKGYTVSVPSLPNSNESNLHDWLPYVLKNETINEHTILIGHSAGSPLILSILENINCTVKQVILVAGFIDTLESKILQTHYNWERIRSHCQEFIFINSNDDPWQCDDTQGRKMFDHLGGTLIIRHNQGHMGSHTFNQPYQEFPFLLSLIKD